MSSPVFLLACVEKILFEFSVLGDLSPDPSKDASNLVYCWSPDHSPTYVITHEGSNLSNGGGDSPQEQAY